MTEGNKDIGGGVSIAPEVEAFPLFGKSHIPILIVDLYSGHSKLIHYPAE